MRAKEKSDKAGLKFSIKKKKKTIIASHPITSWRKTDAEKLETVIDLIFLVSKITADGDCSRQIKRCLLLGR